MKCVVVIVSLLLSGCVHEISGVPVPAKNTTTNPPPITLKQTPTPANSTTKTPPIIITILKQTNSTTNPPPNTVKPTPTPANSTTKTPPIIITILKQTNSTTNPPPNTVKPTPTPANSTTSVPPRVPTSPAQNNSTTTPPPAIGFCLPLQTSPPPRSTKPPPRTTIPATKDTTPSPKTTGPSVTKDTTPSPKTTGPSVTTKDTTPSPKTTGPSATNAKDISERQLSAGQKQDGNLRASRSRSLNGWFACGSNTFCVSGRATCAVDANDIGTCTCIDGYGGDLCESVDECATMSPCPGGSVCVDMAPPLKYKCVCKDGYTPFLPDELPAGESDTVPLAFRPLLCNDDDECAATNPCHEDATCTNTVGGYECECNEGLIGNGKTVCREPDVVLPVTDPAPKGFCLIDTDCEGANMQCDNSQCVCPAGYVQVGGNCQNIQHCDPDGANNDCHKRATCTEESGFPGFSCACISGWEDAFPGANGKSCKDVPVTTPDTEPEEDPAADDPVTEATPDDVGPSPNRPTVFGPTCAAINAQCTQSSDCCGGMGCAFV